VNVREGEVSPKKGNRILNIKRAALVLGILLLFFAAGIAAGVWIFLSSIHTPTPGSEADRGQAVADRVNILVMGLDAGVNGPRNASLAYTSRTDTMMVVSLDPEFKTAGILSIPRDTRVRIPGRSGYDKIAHAHAYGGPKLAMETVQSLIGEKVPYYVRVDFQGFVKIIDMIGGVEMNIEHDMDYDDPYQDLHIHIKAGKQVLNGEKSLQFVRYRQYPAGDIDRVKAQQRFISAVMKSFFEMNTLWKLPNIAREAAQFIDTNIDPAKVLALANLARQVEREDVRMEIVPGQPADITEATGASVSYWVADQQQLKKCVDLLIRGIDREANSKVRVEVLNGTDVPGLADKVARLLRDQGYLVIRVGNAENPNKGPTQVLGPAQGSSSVKGVCREVLKVSPEATVLERAVKEDVDVSVVLGADCMSGQ
jgi:LCP family protein required for cell wall assembly